MSLATAGRARGLTVVECCVALAVAAVLVALALPFFGDGWSRRHLAGRAHELSADLQYLRTEAVARNRAMHISLSHDAGGDCYVLHSGDADACRCDGDAPSCEAGAVPVKAVRLPASGPVRLKAHLSSMAFNPVRGNATPMNKFVLRDAKGREVRHVVSILGRVQTCTTLTDLDGYPPC